jgi:hypothetical protein
MVIFLAFVGYQIYFYNIVYKKNLETLKKIESFESDVKGINETCNNTSYSLSDEAITNLLDDFNNIKSNI